MSLNSYINGKVNGVLKTFENNAKRASDDAIRNKLDEIEHYQYSDSSFDRQRYEIVYNEARKRGIR